jgi:hypothetical protein
MFHKRLKALVVCLVGLCLTTDIAKAETKIVPVHHVISVGANRGLTNEEPLRYAGQDAARFLDLMTELGNAARSGSKTIQKGDAEDVFSAIEQVHKNTKDKTNDVFVFYFAGHGDDVSLHLGTDRLELTNLFEAIEKLPFRLKLIIIDACRTSGGARNLGIEVGAGHAIQLKPLPSGTIVLHSTGFGEPAQESESLKGAVFSHYLMAGLRGPADSNQDGQVTFEEAYLYSYSKTIQRTAGSQYPVQHPAYDITLKGAGPIVLTRLNQGRAKLVFSPEEDSHLFVYRLPQGDLVAELAGDAEKPTMLTLPAGRFEVQRKKGQSSGKLTVHLPWGGVRQIRPQDFTQVEKEAFVMRGSDEIDWRWHVQGGYLAAFSNRSNASLANGLMIAPGISSQKIRIDLAISYLRTDLEYDSAAGVEERIIFRPMVSLENGADWLRLRYGLGVLIEPIWQSLTRTPQERFIDTQYDYHQSFWSTSVGASGIIGCSLALFEGVTFDMELAGNISWLEVQTREEKKISTVLGMHLFVGLGYQ